MQMIFTANSRKPYVCFQKEAFQWDFEALILSGMKRFLRKREFV